MNRELKFRAWLESCKTMLHDITLYPDMIGLGVYSFEKQLGSYEKGFEFDGEDVITTDDNHEKVLSVLSGEDWVYIEPSDYQLMQYTGLKDKNGKEIYEGDILKVCDGSINRQPWFRPNHVVKYEVNGFNVPKWMYNQTDSTHWCELIGNIYQNSKLISHDKM